MSLVDAASASFHPTLCVLDQLGSVAVDAGPGYASPSVGVRK